MSATPNIHKRRSPMQVLSQWWQAWTNNTQDLANPGCCLDGEVERLATDIGMPTAEVRRLASQGPEAADLLLQRLTALALDRKKIAQIEPQTVRDLQRVCTLCESRKQCSFDLALDVPKSNWESYCPNVATLKLLQAASPPANNRR